MISQWISANDEFIVVADEKYAVNTIGRIRMLSVGKAATAMAAASFAVLGGRISEALVITKEGHQLELLPWPVYDGGHPLPDERSVAAAQRVNDFVRNAKEEDLLLVMISGGASALLADLPDTIPLADWRELTNTLLRNGAPIDVLNTVRKHFSLLKGGRLAVLAQPAKLHSLIISDVPDDDLAVIASGLTVPDPTTWQQAESILQKFIGDWRLPASLQEYLNKGLNGGIPETPKPGDPAFERVRNTIIGNNRMALEAAALSAEQLGYRAIIHPVPLSGEAREISVQLLTQLSAATKREGVCYLAGGETTVTVKGRGKGGRNQEFVLAAVNHLMLHPDLPCPALLCAGTDGTDGPTDAAGASIDAGWLQQVSNTGPDPQPFLDNNDAYAFFEQTGGLVKTGPTLTNVMDVMILIPATASPEDEG
ncbi:glycerate kinase [Flavihumibacter petaseus NBRC 106054]|uniref:Glycerate kinase n=1 Tax=Flavihumibacter petaseus NBRC 106054 TaxID=1220578 RepID=A0A0E9N4S1_9BACT|nr:glycerate kinase [Flavihumibacter petaseus NBRC 106054]